MQLKIIIVVLFTTLIFLSGCVTEQTGDENQNELTIPGTGACQTILREVASSFNESNPSFEVLVPDSTGSSGGIRSVGEDEYILGRVAREIKDDEMDYDLSYLVFAKGGI